MFCCSSLNLKECIEKNFNIDIKDSDKGIQISIEPVEESKVSVLQDFVNSTKKFCQAFCGC